MKLLAYILGITALVFSITSCKPGPKQDKRILTIFHAGSLSLPLAQMAKEFEKENPGVLIRMEAAGSVDCIRKITDLDKKCDILALSDYSLIDRLMIPTYASWALQFAANRLCIAYNQESALAGIINSSNWCEILARQDVRYGRGDPDSDPCGYRTVICMKLAGLLNPSACDYDFLLSKDQRYIRPKAEDLLALLETKTVDYVFEYASVAVQHKLDFIDLPDSINLGNPDLSMFYEKATMMIQGTEPGKMIEIKGEPMIYGFTIPDNAPNPELAGAFARFLTTPGGGSRILAAMGQKPMELKLSPASLTEPAF